MFRLVVGIAIGYVLGAKAGRERYDQIVRLGSRVSDSPAVQGAAGFIGAKVTGLLPGRKKNARPDAAYLTDDPEPLSPTRR
jgi:hypothetical protein